MQHVQKIRCRCPAALALAIVAMVTATCATPPRTQTVGHANAGEAQTLRFAIVSDNTGGHRTGVFAHAVDDLNLLAPDFVMCVGDLIEGYTTDTSEIDREWDEFNEIVGSLDPPFYYVPGNHDLSNAEMNAVWQRRFGATYYSFVRAGCLFLCLNTEDPSGGHLSKSQLNAMARVLHENAQVRWTFVFMHQPLWTYPHETGWPAMETLLADRPHTVFAGHMHKYAREVRNGMEYITLATTGGGGPMRGVNYGEVDHIAWVTVGDGAPTIANIEIDGIWNTSMFTSELKETYAPVVAHLPVLVMPVLHPGATFQHAETELRLENPTPYPMTLTAHVDESPRFPRLHPAFVQETIPPGGSVARPLAITSVSPLPTEAVPAPAIAWQARYDVPARPPIETHGGAAALVLPAELKYTKPQVPPNASASDIVDTLLQGGLSNLATQAITIYGGCTRSTQEALAFIAAARRAGYAGDLALSQGFICNWTIGNPIDWHFDDGLRDEIVQPKTPSPRFIGNKDTGVVSLLDALGERNNATVFAVTAIDIPTSAAAVFHVRSDDGIALWLNGQRGHANNVIRGVTMAEDHVPVQLRAGVNELAVEVTQGIEGWGFSVRVSRPDGTPLPIAMR